jgi:hypothetical protein
MGDSEGAVLPGVLLLSIKECFVYKVPPLRTASGHRYACYVSLLLIIFYGPYKSQSGRLGSSKSDFYWSSSNISNKL